MVKYSKFCSESFYRLADRRCCVAQLFKSCTTHTVSHLRFFRAIKLRAKVARQNCKCDIGLKYDLFEHKPKSVLAV